MRNRIFRFDADERFDSNESVFLNRQLEVIESSTYRIQYPGLKARTLMPVANVGPGVANITWREWDRVGRAAVIGDKATDLPRADVLGREYTNRVKHLGSSYGFGYFELKEAARAGLNLDGEKAGAARQAIEQEIDRIAFFGDDTNGLPGLFNNASITIVSVPADGTGSSTLWANKSPDQKLRDMNEVCNDVYEASNGVESADTLLMPLEQYTDIATTPRSSTSDTTILEFFLKNHPTVRNVEPSYRCKAVAALGGLDAMVAYRRSPEVLKLHIPTEFTPLPMEQKGLEYTVNCVADIAGLFVYRPGALRIAKGI